MVAGQSSRRLAAIGGAAMLLTLMLWVAVRPLTGERRASDQRAPSFSLQNFSGNTVRLSDFAGNPLVINSWAAWCPFCVQELKDFAAVQDELQGRVVIIAINRGEPLATAKKFADDLGVSGQLVFLQDPADSFYKSISGFAMPETIFVDAQGVIRDHKRGSMSAAEIRRRVSAVLQ